MRRSALICTIIVAGCSAGHTTGNAPPGVAPSTAVVSVTINTRIPAERARKYISPAAKSVAIGVTPSNPAYSPASGCVTIVTGVTTYTVQVPAPIGGDTFTIQAFDGPCVASSSGSSGSGNLLDTTAPITGTVTAGAANVLNPNGVAPAQPCPASCAITIAAAYNAAATAMTASLSTSGSVTTFEMDPGVTMALPVTLTIKDNAGNVITSPDANGQTVPLLAPLTITLADASTNAVGGTIGLALVDGNGNIYCPSPPLSGSFVATFAANATATCPSSMTTAGTVFTGTPVGRVALVLASAPRANDRIVVVYNGATQTTFHAGTLAAASGGVTLASIPIASQSQVATQFTGPASPVGIAVSAMGNIEFVTAGTKVYAQVANSALGAGSNAVAGTNFTGVTFMNSTTPATYVVDSNCANCDLTHVGIYQIGPAPASANGVTPTQLTTEGILTTAGFNQPLIPPFVKGPIGIVALPPSLGGTGAFGSLLVAANNSVTRLDLASTTTISAITLVAGTGVGGTGGQGSSDAAAGIQARFNFGTLTFTGMALDSVGANLFLADPGNNAVRRVALSGTNPVTTYAKYVFPPSGIALDTLTGLVFTTHPTANIIQQVTAAGAPPSNYACNGVVGNQDGLTAVAYPLQFNAGNSVANASASGPLPAYVGLYNAVGTVQLGVNSNRLAQVNAGVANFIASCNGPQGIALDPATNPNGRFYFVDQSSALIRTVF